MSKVLTSTELRELEIRGVVFCRVCNLASAASPCVVCVEAKKRALRPEALQRALDEHHECGKLSTWNDLLEEIDKLLMLWSGPMPPPEAGASVREVRIAMYLERFAESDADPSAHRLREALDCVRGLLRSPPNAFDPAHDLVLHAVAAKAYDEGFSNGEHKESRMSIGVVDLGALIKTVVPSWRQR